MDKRGTGRDGVVRVVGDGEFLELWRRGAWDLLGTTSPGQSAEVSRVVAEIIADVRHRGESALLELTRRLDGVELEQLEVPLAELEAAAARAMPDVLRSLTIAADRIGAFARRTLEGLGPILGRTPLDSLPETAECWCPLSTVGLYVPGGRAPYPSSVLMTAIPARVAGVGQLVMVTPPSSRGVIAPSIAAAAMLAGVDRVFSLGGAQAIAALALGAGGVPQVDKIVGPGNAYVTEAKRQLSGEVGIDGLAGPSEVVAVAGRPGCAGDLAAQLLAQAEHDPDALSLGVLLDRIDPAEVVDQLVQGLAELPPARAQAARQALASRGALIQATGFAGAAAIVREVCPEHLWVDLGAADDAFVLEVACYAGAVFIGRTSPVALGDYIAGPNHVLPTGRSARWASPLGPVDCMRRVSLIRLSPATARELAPHAAILARAEGFAAHERSCRQAVRDLEVLDE